jgi:tetratricopeptide (TPR) repeat protein
MALGKADEATKYFAALAASKYPEHQFQARYLEGLALLKLGKGPEALQRFNYLLGANIASADGVRIKKLAKCARVSALVLADKTDEALKDLEPLIVENDPAEVEVSARLYNAQGKCLLKKEDFEGATLAFLHTDLLFSASGDAHAEALLHLAELWNKLGHPDRAATARTRLSQLYPGYKG